MAFMDFMRQGIGGMEPAQTTPGLMDEGNVTTQHATPLGPTYDDILKGAIQYGSKPGSSGPALARGMSTGGGWQQRQMQPLAPTAPPQAKQAVGQADAGGGDDNLAAIAKFFTMLFGVGGGV